jgi:hypothetical protein
MVQVHYMHVLALYASTYIHVWKYHNEASYYVQFNIANLKRKVIT